MCWPHWLETGWCFGVPACFFCFVLDTIYAPKKKKTKGRHLNQSGEAMSRVTVSSIFFQGHDD